MKTKNDIITHLLVRCVIFTVFLLAFPQTALLQSPDGTFLHDEAGIAAYTYFPQGLDLFRVALSLRTMEATTGDYIIGIIDVPGFTSNYDVRIYAQSNGWMMAYYPPEALVSEFFLWNDFYFYDTINVLASALHFTAAADGKQPWNVDYFHFKYPNADWLLLIQKYAYGVFTVEVPPGNLFGIREASWVLGHTWRSNNKWAKYFLDGELLASRYSYGWTYDVLPMFRQAMVHSFELQGSGEREGPFYSFFTLTYQDPRYFQATITVRDADSIIRTPLRYPEVLINDTTPPAISPLTYEEVQTTWTWCKVSWTVNELSECILKEFRYTDGVTYTVTHGYRQVEYEKNHYSGVSCHEAGAIYSYQVTATDISGNVSYSPRYRYQVAVDKVYLPLVIRHTP